MPRRKVEPAVEPGPLVCELCGVATDRLSNRHPPSGLACCAQCVLLPSSEVAAVWLRRIRKVVER